MWPSLARTRRRLLGGVTPSPAPSSTDVSDLVGDETTDPDDPSAAARAVAPPAIDEVVLTIGRPELDRLGSALQQLLGPATSRPDTPARLEAALAAAVERLGGTGRPRVTRRPAGLYTPEAWQVRMTGIDPAIGEAVHQAARGQGFGR